jgi:hypothetical protein
MKYNQKKLERGRARRRYIKLYQSIERGAFHEQSRTPIIGIAETRLAISQH